MTTAGSSVTRAPRPSSLADVLDLILDKGLVIDAYVRVSLVGIELLTIDARVVIASVDTYLHYAEAVNRLDLQATETAGIPALFGEDNHGNGNGNGNSGRNDRGDGDGASRPSRRPARQSLPEGRSDKGSEDRSSEEEGEQKRGRSLAGRIGERGRRD